MEEALRAVAQIGQGERIGILEAGKEADLVIWKQDPFKVEPDGIMKINLPETFVGGEKLFS